jgi:hypothetical protein
MSRINVMEPLTTERNLPPVTTVPDLRLAIRRARLEEAERSSVVTELRSSEIARLELLSSQLQPVLSQIPASADMFDCGLSVGDRPRLFVDMIAHVEMGHDRKTYRFLKDTRDGRVTLAESSDAQVIVDAVTNYIARRLVEREKALAADLPLEPDTQPQRVAEVPAPQRGQDATLGEFVFTFIAGLISGAAVLYAVIKLDLMG